MYKNNQDKNNDRKKQKIMIQTQEIKFKKDTKNFYWRGSDVELSRERLQSNYFIIICL
jgi:hypothetical protein